MIGRLIVGFLLMFGALQATASAFDDHSTGKNDERRTISFDINRGHGCAHDSRQGEAKYFQQLPAAASHIAVAVDTIPDLILIAVLDLSEDNRRISSPQFVPRIRLFKVLFPTIISPNAP